MRHWIGCLLCWLLVGSAAAQDIVVNEYFNSGSVGSEYIELLVLTDKLDLRGYQVRDFVSGGMNPGSVDGTITFSNDALWECVRSGYIIVIDFRDSASSDASFSDGVVTIGEQDTQYFSSVGSPNIAGDRDGVEILNGSGNHVHGLTHGNGIQAGSPLETAGTTSPSAAVSGSSTSEQVVRFFDTDDAADFDNNANAEHSAMVTKGAPNNPMQESFRAKRLPIWINEIKSDPVLNNNDGSEFVEIVGPTGFNLGGYQLEIYTCSSMSSIPRSPAQALSAFTFPDDLNKFGFFLIAGPSLLDPDVNQFFSVDYESLGPGINILPDGSGILVLKDASGHEVFDYQYDTSVGGVPVNCPDTRTTRSVGDTPVSPQQTIGFLSDTKPSDTESGTLMLATPGEANDTGQQLPVELTAFEAVADGEAVMLHWETASETNNAGFEIQQLSPTQNWDVLAFMEGHGTTEQAQTYAHRIDYLLPGVHRFRLKQIDYDGTFEYSPEVEVAIGVPGAYHLTSAYPNPFNPETSFSLSVARAQEVQVAVYNVVGRRVALLYEGPFPAETSRAFRFEADALPSGVYLLRVLGEQFVTTQPLVLTK